jgi:hypothetical protein
MQQDDISAEDIGFMLEAVKLPEVRSEICEYFRTIQQPIQITKNESFVALGWLGYALLDNIEIRSRNEDGISQVEAVMSVSMFLFIMQGKVKVTLATELDNHRMWRNTEMWILALRWSIETKIKATE